MNVTDAYDVKKVYVESFQEEAHILKSVANLTDYILGGKKLWVMCYIFTNLIFNFFPNYFSLKAM